MTQLGKRSTSTPGQGATRGAAAGALGAIVAAVAANNGVDPNLAVAAVPVVTGVAGYLGKEARDFRASGQGGFLRMLWSWIF